MLSVSEKQNKFIYFYFSQPLPSSPCRKERLHLSPNLSPQARGLTAPPRRSYTKVGGASKPSPDCFMQLGLLCLRPTLPTPNSQLLTPHSSLPTPPKTGKIKKNALFLKKVAKIFGGFRKTHYLCTRFETPSASQDDWRGGRVVDYSGLENRRAERHRGFESLPLRS